MPISWRVVLFIGAFIYFWGPVPPPACAYQVSPPPRALGVGALGGRTGNFDRSLLQGHEVLSVPMLKPAEPALRGLFNSQAAGRGLRGAGAQAVCRSIPLSLRGWLCGRRDQSSCRCPGAEAGSVSGGRAATQREMGESQKAFNFPRGQGEAGPLLGQHPEGAQSLAVGSQAGVGAGTLGGKETSVGWGWLYNGVYDDWVLIVCAGWCVCVGCGGTGGLGRVAGLWGRA